MGEILSTVREINKKVIKNDSVRGERINGFLKREFNKRLIPNNPNQELIDFMINQEILNPNSKDGTSFNFNKQLLEERKRFRELEDELREIEKELNKNKDSNETS